MLVSPGLRLGAGPVPDTHIMAGRFQMPGHRIAHHAQSEKGGNCHEFFLPRR